MWFRARSFSFSWRILVDDVNFVTYSYCLKKNDAFDRSLFGSMLGNSTRLMSNASNNSFDDTSLFGIDTQQGVLGFPFPRHGKPFLSMFWTWLKVHTHFYYLFAEICYGFWVPRNGEPKILCGFRIPRKPETTEVRVLAFLGKANQLGFLAPEVPKPGFKGTQNP
jgi:hypothetical protein